ncbi:hypothetical protein [Bradyrhizobium sp. USDA 3262]
MLSERIATISRHIALHGDHPACEIDPKNGRLASQFNPFIATIAGLFVIDEGDGQGMKSLNTIALIRRCL